MTFSPYYELYVGLASSVLSVVAKQTHTTWSSSSMNPGLYNWKVAAFNGFARTFSEQRSFEMCTPGTLGLPSLNPSSGTMEVGNVSLSWTVSWNDTCFENHVYSMMIWNSSSRILFNSGALNSSQTSVFFDEEEAGLLGLKNSVTYSWGVEAKKGSQSKQTNSTFVYCKPASEVIQLSTPGFVIISFVFVFVFVFVFCFCFCFCFCFFLFCFCFCFCFVLKLIVISHINK